MRLALGVILTALSFTVAAQGYLVSSDGKAVRDSQGVCVKTGSWQPGDTLAECEPAKPAPSPVAKVQPAPPAAPAPASKPAPEVKKVVVQADVLFAFNDAVLTDKGKAELDKLAAGIQAGTKVVVVGHADVIGDANYNKQLSLRRAKTVASYLNAKVGKGTFEVSGVGSAQPTKDTTKCKDIKNWKEKVACYAPDRRVEVEYTSK